MKRKTIISIVAITISVGLAFIAIKLFGNYPQQVTGDTNDNSAIILFIISGVGLIVLFIIEIIKKVKK